MVVRNLLLVPVAHVGIKMGQHSIAVGEFWTEDGRMVAIWIFMISVPFSFSLQGSRSMLYKFGYVVWNG